MICLTLFKRELKSNYWIGIICGAVMLMYVFMVVQLFDPSMNEMLNNFTELMPEIMSAFGMADIGSTLIEMLASYLYNMVFLIMPLILELIISGRLVAKYIDNGSMAYLLATPKKRGKIIVTQLFTLLFFQVVTIIIVTLFTIAVAEYQFPGQLDIGRFLLVNMGLFCLHLCLGGICFISSCCVNDSKSYYGIAAGLTVGFYFIQMIVNLSKDFELLKYVTPFTLYQPMDIARGGEIWGAFVLVLIGIVLMITGCMVFRKREIHL